MRFLLPFFLSVFSLQAQVKTIELNNTKPVDTPKTIRFSIEASEIRVHGLEELFDTAEKRFNYAPKYIDCETCAVVAPTVVYTIVLDYTFGNAAGSKSAALIWRRSAKEKGFPKQGLLLSELSEDELISQESFVSTIDRGANLYVRMKEMRGHVLNNGIHTDKKALRLGKLFRTP
jgi:hypothetical protein